MPSENQSGSFLNREPSAPRGWLAAIDRAGWRRFFLALFALTVGLFLALYATALSQSGRYRMAATIAGFSLLLTALVAIRVVPALARRTTLRRWLIRIDYEFTREGAVYLAMILVITVAALNTGNNLLFIILACMLAAMLASGILSWIVLQGLGIDLALPDHVFAEQPVLARLRLQNRKEFLPTFSVTLSGTEPLSRKFRKQTLPSAPAILTRNLYFPYIPHRSSAQQDVKLDFPRRGSYLQESLRVSTRFPFGFVRKTRSVPCGRQAVVLPNVQPTEKFFSVLPQLGSEMDSYLKGLSHDLYAIRNYQQSDSARHVDWKATARVQQLKVREFTREDERRVRIVFDNSVPDARPRTLAQFEKVVTLCACIAWYFYEVGTNLGFAAENFEIPILPADQVVYPILEKLALIQPVPAATTSPNGFAKPTSQQEQAFQIILTFQPPESFPADQRRSSYFLLTDSS
jgi:uncharacterized protein (DUF58 family)